MSKTFTLNEQTSGPSGVTAVAVAGGSLTASTTYYYKVVVGGYGNYYWSQNCWYSAPSTEVSATTTSTNKTIWIHFDNNLSPTQSAILWRTTTSGQYGMTDGSGNPTLRLARPTGYGGSTMNRVRFDNVTTYRRYTFTTTGTIASLVPGETITQTSTGATAKVLTDPAGGTTFKVWTITGTWSGASTFNGSISGSGLGTWASTSAIDGYVLEDTQLTCDSLALPTNGLPCLVLEGGTEVDPITPQDIYDYLVSVGKTQYIDVIPCYPTGEWVNSSGNDVCAVFNFKFSLADASDGSNWFKIPGGVAVYQAQAKHCFRGKTVFGEPSSSGYTTTGCALIGNWPDSDYSCLAYGYSSYGPAYMYASIVGVPFKGATHLTRQRSLADPRHQVSGSAYLEDSYWQDNGRFNNSCTMYNSRVICSVPEVGGNANGVGWDLVNAKFDSTLSTSTNSGENTHKGLILTNRGTYDYRIRNYGVSDCLLTYHVVDNVFLRSTPSIQFHSSLTTATDWDAVLLEEYTTVLKIIDENNNPIENAVVTIVDKDNKIAIFDSTSTTYTESNPGRTGTSISVNSGKTLDTGSYYRVGNEIIYVSSGSGTGPYTIVRGQDGSSALKFGKSSTRRSYFYKRYNSVLSDSNGVVSVQLNHSYYQMLDLTSGGAINTYHTPTRVLRSPFKIVISKSGYETYVMPYVADTNRDLVISLKSVVPVFVTDGEEVVLRNNPDNYTNRNTATIVK